MPLVLTLMVLTAAYAIQDTEDLTDITVCFAILGLQTTLNSIAPMYLGSTLHT